MTKTSHKQNPEAAWLALKPTEEEEEAMEAPTEDEEEEARRQAVIPYLLRHAYHLPGHNYDQDWWQYMTNNHPVLGICLHHPYHPLGWKVRALSSLGSLLLGLALTNLVYLAFVFVDLDSEQTLVSAQQIDAALHGNATLTETDDFKNVLGTASVTTGNLVLWLVGAPIHGLYDSIAWALMGCGCCRRIAHHSDSRWAKLCRTSGAFLVSLGVIVLVCIASFASLLRAALEADEDLEITVNLTEATHNNPTNWTMMNEWFPSNVTNGTLSDSPIAPKGPHILDSHVIVQDEWLTLVHERDFENYQFVVSYLVELLLNYALFYPMVSTLFFSGVLACCCGGKYQRMLFGGRPYEVQQAQELARQAAEEEVMEPGVEVEYQGKDNDMEQPAPAEPKSNTHSKPEHNPPRPPPPSVSKTPSQRTMKKQPSVKQKTKTTTTRTSTKEEPNKQPEMKESTPPASKPIAASAKKKKSRKPQTTTKEHKATTSTTTRPPTRKEESHKKAPKASTKRKKHK